MSADEPTSPKTISRSPRSARTPIPRFAAGFVKQVFQERNRRWQEENREAIEGWNAWIEERGLPLEQYRQF